MTLTIGQSLTPEQVRDLPDGAVVDCLDRVTPTPYRLTVRDQTAKRNLISDLAGYVWISITLVSLPTEPSRIEPQADLPVWVITCDRCGTTYKNNERHACVARDPAPRPVSEIEKEAAIDFSEIAKSLCIQRLYIVQIEEVKYREEMESAIEAHERRTNEIEVLEAYARSIGAIE